MSRTKNVIKMVLASTINQVVVMVAGLILPPLIISNYGSAVNGLVNSVKQILNYFQVVSVGMGAAGQLALYEPIANDNKKKINQIMTELSSFLNKMGAVFCGIVGVVAFVLPIIRNDGIPKSTIVLIVLICGLGSLIEFAVLTKYKILLTANQRQYISSRVNTEGTIINVVLSATLIFLKAPIVCVQLVATFAYVIRMCLLIRTVKHLYPDLDMKCHVEQKLISNQRDALLYKLTDVIINYTPMTIVMLIGGFSDVSVYTVYNLVFSAIVMMVNIFSNGFASAFGNQIAEKNYDALRNSFQGYSFVFRTISYWLYATAAVLIIPFMSVYIRNSDGVNYLIPSLGVCFALNGLFRAIRTPAITIIDATGMYKENLALNYCEAGLNIILSVVLTLKFGMIGVLIGGLISSLIRSLFFIRQVDLEVVRQSFTRDILLLGSNMAVAVVSYLLFYEISSRNFLEWIFKAILVAGVNGIMFGVLNVLMDIAGFSEFFNRIKGVVRK